MKRFWPLGVVLGVILLIRIPSFFEPYWYGDEGIYLAVAQALRRGEVLYRDIWDNKTPLLYFIYGVIPALWWAKLAATGAVLGTVVGAWILAKKVFAGVSGERHISLGVAAVCGLGLSLPLLEGTIANAELFFVLPIVWAAILTLAIVRGERRMAAFLGWGILGAGAFLIKVPAVFDFLGFGGFLVAYAFRNFREKGEVARKLGRFVTGAGLGFGIPIALTFVFFWWQGALGDFVTAAFAQNASYVAVGSGPFSQLSNPLVVKGLALVAGSLALAGLYFKRWVTTELLLIFLWLGFSLYGALLSNRPYPHYLLQAVLPTILAAAYVMTFLKKYWVVGVALGAVIILATKMFWGQMYFMTDLFKKGEIPYYQNFWDYMTEKKTGEEYAKYFDRRAVRDYEISRFIRSRTAGTDSIFVWGDESFIYVLSERRPATRFIQAHHLTTIDPKNYELVAASLEEKLPKLIFVVRPVRFPFEKLEELLDRKYRMVRNFGEVVAYEKIGK